MQIFSVVYLHLPVTMEEGGGGSVSRAWTLQQSLSWRWWRGCWGPGEVRVSKLWEISITQTHAHY